jgi:two-component system CheB/CheR fusion protein
MSRSPGELERRDPTVGGQLPPTRTAHGFFLAASPVVAYSQAMAQTLASTEYRLLVEHSPVMIWRSGPDARCDYFNETWLAFTGRTLEQEMGYGWSEGVHRDDVRRCVERYLDHFHRREPFEMEYRLRSRTGAYRWIFDRGVPFTDERGEFGGFVGSCIDVDDRRKAEAAREQRDQEQLALARNFEKRILAIVGHDIRNPLGTIKLTAEYLQRVAEPAGIVDEQVQKILRAVGRIQHIAGDLLDLSHLREGSGIPIARKTTDLRAICRQVIDELHPSARDRAITFDCDVDSVGAWDEHRVLQAISNLVSNAVQHGATGSAVRMRLTGDDERVTVEVQNEGAIPDETVPRLFEPFHASREYKRGEGVGLGLFIARAIASAHGGDLEFDSAGGVTTFRLVLPRGRLHPSAAASDLSVGAADRTSDRHETR